MTPDARRQRARELANRITKWRYDDRVGYDVAIDLLYEAEAALLAFADAEARRGDGPACHHCKGSGLMGLALQNACSACQGTGRGS